jgi:adenylate cyclase class 2
MKTEIEVKFLDVDFDTARQKLQALGAVCKQPMRLMQRAIIDFPDERLQKDNAYIRVRDEGDKTTVTFKQFKALRVDGAKEIETIVGSFEDTVNIFKAIGLKVRSVQESKRETWQMGNVEVVLDEWPWLKPYVELEGENEAGLRDAAEKLGFDWKEAVFGDVTAVYRAQYPHISQDINLGAIPEVRFDVPLPDILRQD